MRIVNIGSLNIDYVYDVRNFVQKGQTISSEGRSTFAGGKGLNQSIALGRAGIEVCHAGLVGPEGAPLRDLLSASGVNVDWVRQTDECATGHAIIQRDREGDNCIILYGGANQSITRKQVEEMIQAFANRRELIMKLLDEVPGLSYVKPYGAFYIMVDVSGLGMTSTEFAQKLLEEKYVATVPAVGLDDKTGKYVRFSYATSEENIREGLRRVKELAEELQK